MNVFVLGLLSSLLFWPMIGSAALYKWVDDQGNLHITDTPPPMTQKKSAMTAVPAPRSALPKKTTVWPTLPGQPQAAVHPVPGPSVTFSASEDVPIQRAMEGLSPSQATLMSAWRIFEEPRINAKAPVQRWKDEQGLDHFVDILPIAKTEDGSVSHSIVRPKERGTRVSRSRHQATE
jgi:hypothetical protein